MDYKKTVLAVNSVCDYSIDTNGVIINETTGKEIKGSKITKSNRYKKFCLDNERFAWHRLVAEHFVENPDPLTHTQVNHIDGDRYNNKAENLEWVTPKQNVKHAYNTGLKTNAGEKNPISKLTEQVVIDIWKLSVQGHKPAAIIRLLNLDVSRGCVSAVTNRKSWTHITDAL